MERILVKRYESPCGELLLGALGQRLCLCDWVEALEVHRRAVDGRLRRRLKAEFAPGESATLDLAVRQLDEFFAGTRREFSVPVLFVGTDFQVRVWQALLSIPYGGVTSYSALAAGIGCASAVRAVAGAVGANALSVFVACHRVMGRDGSLTGYAGGVDAKLLLLRLEQGSRSELVAQ